MTRPADLIHHYSSQAFKTRIFALTFVGAVAGYGMVREGESVVQNLLGLALLLVIASLAELNRRYTYSYLCACLAESRVDTQGTTDRQVWREFVVMNEGPWSGKKVKVKNLRQGGARRFLLSWATYLPGLITGAVLSSMPGLPFSRPLGIAFSFFLLIWWITVTVRVIDPEQFLDSKTK